MVRFAGAAVGAARMDGDGDGAGRGARGREDREPATASRGSGTPRGSEPGRYAWTMEADGVRPAGGARRRGGRRVAYRRPAARPPATAASCSQPRVVSPDGDGYADLLTVRYTLGEPATVSAALQDESGLTVVSLAIDVRQAAGAQTLSWAARPAARRPLPASSLTARGDSGRTARLVDELVVMRALAWLRADPSTISPNGDGVGDSITISFGVRQAGARGRRDAETAATRSRSSRLGWLEPGSHAILWNGRLPEADRRRRVQRSG